VPPPSSHHSQAYHSHGQDAPYNQYRYPPQYPSSSASCECQQRAYYSHPCHCSHHPHSSQWQHPFTPDPRYPSPPRAVSEPCHCSHTQSPPQPSPSQWSSGSSRIHEHWEHSDHSPPKAQSFSGPPTRFTPVNQGIRKFAPIANAFDDPLPDPDPRSKHVCHACRKTFTRPSSLRIHMNTHTGATRKHHSHFLDLIAQMLISLPGKLSDAHGLTVVGNSM
jgi:hypothetical protein